MSNINGVKILKQSGQLKKGPNGDDRISGLIAIVAAPASGLAVNTSALVTKLSEAEALGINAAYDTTNSEVLYHNISEFFRLSPEGKLWIMLVDDASTPAQVLDDASTTMARKLLTDAAGKIRQLALQVNNVPLAGTFVNGIPTEISAAIPKVQTFADWAYTNFKPCNVLLEGCNIQTPLSGLGDLRAITNVSAPKCSLVIGQDKAVSDQGAAYSKRAAVGAALGMVSARKVNENIGWVEKGNLTDAATGRFLSACLSNGTAIETYESSWQDLEDKGYIFVMPYAGIEGYYFNNDHTCADVAHDEAFISRGRVKDKAARLLRTALLPKVKSPVPVDPTTGKLPQVQIEYFNSLGENALEDNMENNSEISGKIVRVDPDSDLINAPKTLKASFAIVPYGEVGEIEGTLEFVTSIS